MLPRLASFFNITIDQLMGYRPQLSREEIRQVYEDLAKEFTVLPFEKVLEHCREYIREYSSCYPLLFQMATLLSTIFLWLHLLTKPRPLSGKLWSFFKK